VKSGRVGWINCWPSPAHSFLVSGLCFEMGRPLQREEGSDYCCSLPSHLHVKGELLNAEESCYNFVSL
jgi:hypothetical protein